MTDPKVGNGGAGTPGAGSSTPWQTFEPLGAVAAGQHGTRDGVPGGQVPDHLAWSPRRRGGIARKGVARDPLLSTMEKVLGRPTPLAQTCCRSTGRRSRGRSDPVGARDERPGAVLCSGRPSSTGTSSRRRWRSGTTQRPASGASRGKRR